MWQPRPTWRRMLGEPGLAMRRPPYLGHESDTLARGRMASPLELLHPDGDVTSALLVLGQGCPPPCSGPCTATGRRAPWSTSSSSRRRPTSAVGGSWLERGSRRPRRARPRRTLLVYVLAGPRARRRLGSPAHPQRALERRGCVSPRPRCRRRHATSSRSSAVPFRYAFSWSCPERAPECGASLRPCAGSPWLEPVDLDGRAVRDGIHPDRDPDRRWNGLVPASRSGRGTATAITRLPHSGNGAPIVHAFAAGAARPSFVAKLSGPTGRARGREHRR